MKKKEDDIETNTSAYTTSSADVYSSANKFSSKQGHGFAAERANHLNDILSGKNAKLWGMIIRKMVRIVWSAELKFSRNIAKRQVLL